MTSQRDSSLGDHRDNPLVVQADRTILLEVHHPRYAAARDRLARFAELEKSPEHVHFYKITPISIWNAAALGEPLEEILGWLQANARFPVADNVLQDVRGWYERYGTLRLVRRDDAFELVAADRDELELVVQSPSLKRWVQRAEDGGFLVQPAHRGDVKQALTRLGYPVDDRGGYRDGAALAFSLAEATGDGAPFGLRSYQQGAADAFYQGGADAGGCGVVVLPCGAGKTVVALGVMALLQTNTLVLTTNTVAVRQWRREILDKTSLTEDQVGEYTGDTKEIRPVTVATYQILTHRRSKVDEFEHFGLFDESDWGLLVYDEVHLLPAPVFRATAGIQARRRLGLTATLIREDGKEEDVFSLIGPKRFEVPWKDLEQQGFLAAARCVEVRVAMDGELRQRYLAAGKRQQFGIASNNPRKGDALARLLERHRHDRVLVIGQFLDQLDHMARLFSMPLITGRTPTSEREALFARFRSGEIPHLMVSKVGNFAVDLPDANVAIQISGTFGSRQEEAQRLGRILRPKPQAAEGAGDAVFYSLVTDDSRDQEFASKRQLFLTEQGYSYEIVEAADLMEARK